MGEPSEPHGHSDPQEAPPLSDASASTRDRATSNQEESTAATESKQTPTADDQPIAPGQLPASYDRLVPITQLTHGQYNPRNAQPSETLRRSVATEGLVNPLIVWPTADGTGEATTYHITDGWQRYQAAVAAGWEHLPVRICETPLTAISETATRGEVDAFSTYHWAILCQNVAEQLTDAPTSSDTPQVQQVADMVNRTPQTVRKYLAVLSLPEILHPLLKDGPAGTDSEWAALTNYNEAIRRYDGLRWETAHHLARHADSLTRTRLLGVAATAVEFQTAADAQAYITLAADEPQVPLDTLQKRVRFGGQSEETLELPRTAIRVDPDAKRALMEYCRQHRQSLSDLIEQRLRQVITEIESS